MRLGLSQQLRTEQRLIQSPQMIQAMKILQCPMQELREQVEQELSENVFLELVEGQDSPESSEDGFQEQAPSTDGEERYSEDLETQISQELDSLEERTERIGSYQPNQEEAERRYEMLYNTPGPEDSLAQYLLDQINTMDIRPELHTVAEHLIYSMDDDGRLTDSAEQVAMDLDIPIPLAEEGISLMRSLDPAGVGAHDLQDCLLLQLDRMTYVSPLTRKLVMHHLDDLALNKLPKIARDTGANIEEIKDSWEFLRIHLHPQPGSGFRHSVNGVVSPDVIVEEVEGKFEVSSLRGDIPELRISSAYRTLLKEAKNDPKIGEYLKRKIEAAKWFIESIHQRQNTVHRIAAEIVKRQPGFLREGTKALKPMKMQDVADAVGVHISTVSRAVSGKYIQTPQGIMEMKRFFSGGTITDSGQAMSQQAIKLMLQGIVEKEDRLRPYSDDQLVEILGEKGVHIARRTVTKYRKALGIAASSRRKQY